MNVLVIGAAGFIGSHLAKKLHSLGHRVCGADSNSDRAKHVLDKNIPFYSCDFASQFTVKNVLRSENIELVIQSIGNSSLAKAVANPLKCYMTNVIGNIFLLDSIAGESVSKFMYISSSSVFGEVDKMPIDGNSVRCPINPIGNAQLFMENALESLRVSNGLSYAIVRASNIAGMSEMESEYFVKHPGSGLIPSIVKQITGEIDAVDIFGVTYDTIDSTAERDYVHVDDFCSACANVIPKLLVKGEGVSYNIGSGKKYSVKEVISCAEEIFGVKIKTKDGLQRVGDASRLYFDTNRARNDLDWAPKYDSLPLILKTMLPYYAGQQKERAS
ncbi:MAG: NAD-dependent epimerase/dehydratase family protein [Puniceicoccales bacterium]|nr:NAD-dependent epimerase/dehydratase family protein [Puniceicoccales bacterium]